MERAGPDQQDPVEFLACKSFIQVPVGDQGGGGAAAAASMDILFL